MSDKQRETFEAIFQITKLVEEAVLAREGIKKIAMVGTVTAMSIAFSKFFGVYWEIESPALLIFPTILFNYSLYALYDKLVQSESVPVHASIASAFLRKNPDFYSKFEEKKDDPNSNE